MERFENALQTGEIWKRPIWIVVWTENILRTLLLENDDVTTIMWFPWPSFPQTQIQNDRLLLRFQISLVYCGRKSFIAFSEWKHLTLILRGIGWGLQLSALYVGCKVLGDWVDQ